MKAYVYCDGASKGNPGPSSIGVFASKKSIPETLQNQIRTNQKTQDYQIFAISEAIGYATNNIAEWTALVQALRQARQLGIKEIELFLDSELVVNQMKGIYKVKDQKLIPFYNEAKNLSNEFHSFKIHYIPRKQNTLADWLANQAIQK